METLLSGIKLGLVVEEPIFTHHSHCILVKRVPLHIVGIVRKNFRFKSSPQWTLLKIFTWDSDRKRKRKRQKTKTKKDKLFFKNWKIAIQANQTTNTLIYLFLLEEDTGLEHCEKTDMKTENQTESKPKKCQNSWSRKVSEHALEKRALKIIPSERVTAAHQAKPWREFTKAKSSEC